MGAARAVPAGRRGLALGTPGVSRDPRLPALSSALTLHSTVLRSVACPQRPPPRRDCKTPKRRRAAWAAGGESCEAAGPGLSSWLLGRRAVSQKCSWPFPHPLGSNLAPPYFSSPCYCVVSSRFPDSGICVHPEKGYRALQHPHPEFARFHRVRGRSLVPLCLLLL